ncbi:hypothetical protein P154DRAFT_526508 [Amniculicola lignicola CBS 123094]|uniref:Uncharacterized protein n=1 Tax=Amniculicola lignicola CBS 123094 TaxID=1392246 RepID=A0A6A5W2I5_9PLEO|nr:hypothetical protein P154DRAFT_526508 [Amniculicola lignicola CBS 123094]
MGVDRGFDVYPSLSPQCQGLYEAFLEEVIQKYKDTLHPNTGEPLIQIIGTPETKNAYVLFNVGEGPTLPYRSEYFLRFESKLVSRDNVMPYLKEVYLIARRYFPGNVHFWAAGTSPALVRILDKIPDIREEEGTVREDHEYVYEMLREMKRLAKEDQERSTQIDLEKEAA